MGHHHDSIHKLTPGMQARLQEAGEEPEEREPAVAEQEEQEAAEEAEDDEGPDEPEVEGEEEEEVRGRDNVLLYGTRVTGGRLN